MPFPDKLELPASPSHLTGSVKCWSEPVLIRTYVPAQPDKNPAFLENRVYQGSSGRVYPLPIVESVAREAIVREWQAIHIENEYLRLMIMPELGGRIHVGLDKTNGYDFLYRQNVIKPALVGLAGPWVSGGVEFNWPQHHRPATYMPVNIAVEEHADGSVTVWCSDHDPLERMKGRHGVCLHPRRAAVEIKVRLYNRTDFTQTFLWWTNIGVHVDEHYQSFFPPDVHHVADHAKRAISTFPLCQGSYYGVDYGSRSAQGVPADQQPSQFVPLDSSLPNDLSRYANIPVPTSYMVLHSEGDFFGGYDHKRQAGFVHVADHHIAPGKKQWTWGNSEFGYAWDRNLTDADGPYIELMAGVYTDNQPDFSFLAPNETKEWSQHLYPLQQLGIPVKANQDAALRVTISAHGTEAEVSIYVTECYRDAELSLWSRPDNEQGVCLLRWTMHLTPGESYSANATLPVSLNPAAVSVELRNSSGEEILIYQASEFNSRGDEKPESAVQPLLPSQVASSQELNLIGQHLAQYRHATRSPLPYWEEAIRRDPGDSDSHTALGVHHLRRGDFAVAEQHLRKAIARLTTYNPNPPNGDAFYQLGLTLRYQGRPQEAYNAFYKATWNQGTKSCAYHALAELDSAEGHYAAAVDKLTLALSTNSNHTRARNLGVVLLRKLNRDEEARIWLEQNVQVDLTDIWCRYLLSETRPADNQTVLDLTFDYAAAGLYPECCSVLALADFHACDGSMPTIHYALAYFQAKCDNQAASQQWLEQARNCVANFCFPNRLEELCILEWAVHVDSFDAKAHYYLGNFLYDRRRYSEAIEHWEQSVGIDPAFPTAWRNLGLACFNVYDNAQRAHECFNHAFALDWTDARVFYERDQLWKRTGITPSERLAELLAYPGLVDKRDDLSIELATLYNFEGQHQESLSTLRSHMFQPWEGGEGLAIGQYTIAHIAMGRLALAQGDCLGAKNHFEAGLSVPANLAEARHPLANLANVYYWLGTASEYLGNQSEAQRWWTQAASNRGDFQGMSCQLLSEVTYYGGLALGKLEKNAEAEIVFQNLLEYSEELKRSVATLDYFATSLPSTLLFKDNLDRRQLLRASFFEAQAAVGQGKIAEGTAILQDILKRDPNNLFAADFLEEIQRNRITAEVSKGEFIVSLRPR